MEQLRMRFNAFLDQNAFDIHPDTLARPVRHILASGGKRFRPLLLLAAMRAFDENWEKGMAAAAAIEFFHNFTLLHDDIMDEATTRRGQPAAHRLFGTNRAILSGDAMLIKSYQWLESYRTHPSFGAVLQTFSQTAMDVCRGQQMDMDFETQNDVSTAQYLEMIRLKTAVLLGAALKIGALLAQAPSHAADNLFDFGVQAGMAFQIQDDILDSFGDKDQVGKRIGGDIVQNKKTYLLLRCIENTPAPREIHNLLDQRDNPDEKIARIKALMVTSGALDDARNKRDDFLEKSLQSLAKSSIPEPDKQFFAQMARQMAHRTR